MAKVEDTKFVKVIVSKRVSDKEILDNSIDVVEIAKQGGVIVKDGKRVPVSYTVKIGAEVELPVNIIEYLKDRKAYVKTGKHFVMMPIYNVDKVEA